MCKMKNQGELSTKQKVPPHWWDARQLAWLSERTSLVDITKYVSEKGKHRIKKVRIDANDDGLILTVDDARFDQWPVEKAGSGIDGRVMPGDLRRWALLHLYDFGHPDPGS